MTADTSKREYEAAKIAAGADIRDDHFFDDFHRGREPIATPPGPEEWLVTGYKTGEWMEHLALSGGALAAGTAALLAAM